MNDKELTFKEGHDILKRNAELLESQESPDIDNLMKIVEESIGAYKACKSRIEAVQQALDETFKEYISIKKAHFYFSLKKWA